MTVGLVWVVVAVQSFLGGDISIAAIGWVFAFAVLGWSFAQLRRKEGIVLADRHLVIRYRSAQTTEIPIAQARAKATTVNGVGVVLIEQGPESTKSYPIERLTPPIVRALPNLINTALVERRRELNLPEPLWAD